MLSCAEQSKTRTDAVATCPFTEAVTVVDPTPTPVTRPELSTVATALSLEVHVTLR
jgi:hypothetical protein